MGLSEKGCLKFRCIVNMFPTLKSNQLGSSLFLNPNWCPPFLFPVKTKPFRRKPLQGNYSQKYVWFDRWVKQFQIICVGKRMCMKDLIDHEVSFDPFSLLEVSFTEVPSGFRYCLMRSWQAERRQSGSIPDPDSGLC